MRPEHEDVLLDVRDLRVTYAGAVRALDGVSLAVPDGEVVAVLGSNGAGKSTLLRAVSGTLRGQRGAITGGSIALAGRSLVGQRPGRRRPRRARAGPRGPADLRRLTVAENLRAGGLAARDKPARERGPRRVHELFPILAERARQPAGLLSGGEQQMLAIGRALMAGPRVLLLDEPSLGLAPRIVEQLGEVIREINREGVTVVLVEQNAAMALAVADRAVVLEVGRVALEGSAAELAENEQVRDRYLGGATEPATGEADEPRSRARVARRRADGRSADRPLRRHHRARRGVASASRPARCMR